VVVSDPGTIEADAAAPFVSLVQGDGGQVLSYTDALVQEVDPVDPDRLRLLAQDLAWLAPDALVMAAPPRGRLAEALRSAQRDGAFAPAAPAWIWPLSADQVTDLKEQPWPQLALLRPAVGPGWESFAQRFQERYGQQPDQLAGAGYDTARLLALASVAPAPVSSEGSRDPLGWIDPEASPLPLCEAIVRRRAGQAVRLEGVSSGLDLRPAQAPSGEALTRLIAAR
jgi:neutral amino acid transport system substrate-binding protein